MFHVVPVSQNKQEFCTFGSFDDVFSYPLWGSFPQIDGYKYYYIYSYRVFFFTNYPCFSIRAAYVQEASKDPSPGDGFLVAFPWLYLLS